MDCNERLHKLGTIHQHGLSLYPLNFKVRPRYSGELIWSTEFLPDLHLLGPILCLVFRDVPRTLRDRKKDEFMALKQGSMYVTTYEATFNALSRYDTLLITNDDERIQIFIRGLDSELQVLSVHMNSARNIFNKVTDFVKKIEGLKRDGQVKVLSKRAKNTENFQGSYTRGFSRPTLTAKPIMSSMPASIANYSGTPSNNFPACQSIMNVGGSNHQEAALASNMGNSGP